MKKFKKMMALVLSMVMVLAMGVPAMANVKITVERDDSYDAGATGDRTYTYYQVFRATTSGDFETSGGGVNGDGTPGDITVAQDGASYYLETDGDKDIIAKFSGNKYFNLTPSADGTKQIVTWKNGSTETAIIQEAAKWIVENGAYIEKGQLEYENETKKWSKTVKEGYYVIEGSEGQNLIAATTDINITEKNSYPTIIKEQKDEDTNDYSDKKVDVAVGDVIEYKVRVKIPADTNKDIVVIDKMSAGLDYNKGVGLTFSPVLNEDDYEELTEGTDIEYDKDADWQIKIHPTDAVKGKEIAITFQAKVTSEAFQSDTGRKNDVTLKYGNEHYIMTDTVEYTTYCAGIEKIDGQDENVKLAGVKFTLKEKQNNAEAAEFKVSKDEEGYYYPDEENGSSEVVTDVDGLIKIRGLDKDKTYTVTETETRDGYNLLDGDKALALREDTGNAFADVDQFDKIKNNKGTVLPSTGGIGTTIFYVIGAILIIGAGVLLVTRRRMKAE